MSAAPITEIIPSREEGDCAVTALAMLTGYSYEDVLRAIIRRYPRHTAGNGLTVRQIKSVSADLGMVLHWTKRVDLEAHGLVWTDDHVALVRNGLVVEAEGTGFLCDLEGLASIEGMLLPD